MTEINLQYKDVYIHAYLIHCYVCLSRKLVYFGILGSKHKERRLWGGP